MKIIRSFLLCMAIMLLLYIMCGCSVFKIISENNSSDISALSPMATLAPQDNSQTEYAIEAQLPQMPVQVQGNDLFGTKTQGQSVAEMIYERASYQVTQSDGNMCTVLVSAPDMQTLFSEEDGYYFSDPTAPELSAIEEKRMMESLAARLEQGDYPVRQVEVVMQMQNGQPIFTYEFADAMYGGMLTVWEELVAAVEVG